jgi:hypothetical protein
MTDDERRKILDEARATVERVKDIERDTPRRSVCAMISRRCRQTSLRVA